MSNWNVYHYQPAVNSHISKLLTKYKLTRITYNHIPQDRLQTYTITNSMLQAMSGCIPHTVSCPATPKSASFAWPSVLSRMLPALMSLCIFLRRCRYSSPLSVSHSIVAISSSVSVFLRSLIMSDTEPAPQYSITICNIPVKLNGECFSIYLA